MVSIGSRWNVRLAGGDEVICLVTLGDMQLQFDYALSKLTIMELDALAHLVKMHRGEEE
jgi:hypothetical protein